MLNDFVLGGIIPIFAKNKNIVTMKRFLMCFATLCGVAFLLSSCSKDESVAPAELTSDPTAVDCFSGAVDVTRTAVVRFQTNRDWTVSKMEGKDWCKIEPMSGTASLPLFLAKPEINESPFERTMLLVLTAGEISKEIVIKQAANRFWFRTSAKEIEAGAEGGTFTLNVQSIQDIKPDVWSEWVNVDEVKITDEFENVKTATIVFTVSPNESKDARSSIMAVWGGLSSSSTHWITIKQAGKAE